MANNIVCWKCGNSVNDLPFPLSRLSQCAQCKADLHVCILCQFYDKTRANQCQEPIAEPVKIKDKANFCDYFQPKPNAYLAKEQSAMQSAQQDLAALFGEQTTGKPSSNDADVAKSELEKLFGIKDNDDEK